MQQNANFLWCLNEVSFTLHCDEDCMNLLFYYFISGVILWKRRMLSVPCTKDFSFEVYEFCRNDSPAAWLIICLLIVQKYCLCLFCFILFFLKRFLFLHVCIMILAWMFLRKDFAQRPRVFIFVHCWWLIQANIYYHPEVLEEISIKLELWIINCLSSFIHKNLVIF